MFGLDLEFTEPYHQLLLALVNRHVECCLEPGNQFFGLSKGLETFTRLPWIFLVISNELDSLEHCFEVVERLLPDDMYPFQEFNRLVRFFDGLAHAFNLLQRTIDV